MAILDMFNNVLVLRARLVFYGVLLFFAFFIIIGSASMKNEAPLHLDCPLYCDQKSSGRVDCSSESNCNYPLAIGIIFQLLYLIFRFASLILVILGKLSTDGMPFTNLFELIYVGVDLFACFLTFIGACILSAGTNSTCDDVKGLCDNDDYNDWLPGSRAAQAGSWISTFVWLAVGLIGFLYLFREGKIPFLPGGGGGANKSSAPAPDQSAPPMETPPSNPDDMYPPKY